MKTLLTITLSLLALSLHAGMTIYSAPNESGMVGYWKLDTTNGIDYSSNGNNAVNVGGCTNAPGVNGLSLGFNGSNQQMTNIVPCSTTNFSVCAWLKYASTLPGTTFRMGVGYGNGTAGSFWMGLYNDGSVTISGGDVHNDLKKSVLVDNNWHFYCGVISNLVLYAYYDGSFYATTNTYMYARPSNGFAMGNYVTGVYFWNGFIDEVRVYSRALSATEITNLYNFRQISFSTNGVEKFNP